MRAKTLLGAALLSAGLALPALAQSGPVLTLGPASLTATGLTAGGTAVWLGVTRTSNGVYPRSGLVREESGTDATGYAELSLEADLPAVSVWLVADLASGAWAWAQPEESPAQPEDFPAAAGPVAPDGQVHQVVASHDWLVVLLVRPGVGAWSLLGGDGQDGDADGTPDRSLTLDLAGFETITGSTRAPAELAAGDVLAWIEPRQLVFSATRIPPAAQGPQP